MMTTARREFAANADWLTFCRSAADIRAAVEAGKAAALLSIAVSYTHLDVYKRQVQHVLAERTEVHAAADAHKRACGRCV